jgi:vancomycin resistance protein YoaR
MKLKNDIVIQIPEEKQTVKIKLQDLGLTYDLEEALDKAWDIGHKGNLLTKALSKFQARQGYIVPLESHWDENVLVKTLEETFQVYNRKAQDASFEVTEDNQMLIHPEQEGREIDTEALKSQIQKLNLEQSSLPSLTVPMKPLAKPQITSVQLEELKFTGLLAKYTTSFDSSQLNRTENIRLAAKTLDKKVVSPNEIFSFNESVGERTVEAGYKEALVIVGDAFTPGLGGGVCQVSSTLYNAIKIGQLEVVERHPHSLPVNYVPPGQDATVSYPVLDLKFKNTSGGYLLIRTMVGRDTLTFELYGKIKT